MHRARSCLLTAVTVLALSAALLAKGETTKITISAR